MQRNATETIASGFEPPTLLAIRVETDSAWLTLTCTSCSRSFESCLTTFGSIPLMQCRCPQCGTLNILKPHSIAEAVERLIPPTDPEKEALLTTEATQITETWYRTPAFVRLLDYKGVNLGEGAERELMSFVVQGLSCSAQSSKE